MYANNGNSTIDNSESMFSLFSLLNLILQRLLEVLSDSDHSLTRLEGAGVGGASVSEPEGRQHGWRGTRAILGDVSVFSTPTYSKVNKCLLYIQNTACPLVAKLKHMLKRRSIFFKQHHCVSCNCLISADVTRTQEPQVRPSRLGEVGINYYFTYINLYYLPGLRRRPDIYQLMAA